MKQNTRANGKTNTNTTKIEKPTTNNGNPNNKTCVRQLHKYNTLCSQSWTSCKCLHNKK